MDIQINDAQNIETLADRNLMQYNLEAKHSSVDQFKERCKTS